MPQIKHVGTRRQIREDLNEDLFFRPRRYKFRLPVRHYLDHKRAEKPVCALHMMARFSEELLFRARFGRKNERKMIKPASAFFNEVRRVERNFMMESHAGDRLRDIAPLARNVVGLLDEAREVYSMFGTGADI